MDNVFSALADAASAADGFLAGCACSADPVAVRGVVKDLATAYTLLLFAERLFPGRLSAAAAARAAKAGRRGITGSRARLVTDGVLAAHLERGGALPLPADPTGPTEPAGGGVASAAAPPAPLAPQRPTLAAAAAALAAAVLAAVDAAGLSSAEPFLVTRTVCNLVVRRRGGERVEVLTLGSEDDKSANECVCC